MNVQYDIRIPFQYVRIARTANVYLIVVIHIHNHIRI